MNITHTRRPVVLWARVAALGLAALAVAAGVSDIRSNLSAASRPQVHEQLPVTSPTPALSPWRQGSYSGVVDKVAPAVVTVRVQQRVERASSQPDAVPEFFGRTPRLDPGRQHENALGSGVVIREDGLVLTNHHVVANADRIRVDIADGRSFPATLVGSDEASDLAVLKINARQLPTVPFGDSDRMKVGDVVLAFGNPLGVGQTVTMGIVSAKGRATGISDGSYEDFLQTDAPINQGNSGGALVNLQGELVGINAQIVSPSGGNIGLGFAIPSTMAQAVADQLTHDGVVHRSKLGVTVQAITSELAESLGVPDAHGALVSDVEPGGPADHAGLKQGDVVLQVDGKAVHDANAMRNQIAGTHPGSSVAIVVRRNGVDETKTARLVERERAVPGERHATDSASRNESGFGMAVTSLTPRLAAQLDLPKSTTGLVVADIDPAGMAASAGLQAGDVIKTVNGQTVDSLASLRTALKAHVERPALLLVSRRGADAFIALPRAQS